MIKNFGKAAQVTVAIVCYAAVLLLAALETHSVAGWIVLGWAPVMLVDRFSFQVFPWPDRDKWTHQLAVRLGYVIFGAFWFVFITDTHIAVREALLAGTALSLTAFLFETLLQWINLLFGGTENSSVGRAGALRMVMLTACVTLPLAILYPLSTVHLVHKVPSIFPNALGIAHQDVAVRTKDGLNLAGWSIPAPEARGTVVYLHGYGENRSQVISILQPLHDARFNVVAFDFRGHGQSQGHTVTFGHRETNDVKAACDFARAAFPDQPLFMVGVSYGAAVGLQTLPELSDVRAAWVDSTFASMDNVLWQQFSFLKPTQLQGAAVSIARIILWLDCGFNPDDIQLEQVLNGVNTPLFFVHGQTDDKTSLKQGQELSASYDGPKGYLWLDDSSPRSVSPQARQQYYNRLIAFLEANLPGVELPTSDEEPHDVSTAAGDEETVATNRP
ncbi:MAG: alpha/beta hydrolase [Pirellulales bacterium]|nr:alpha/beta hydrolase [Pirellulales bacterium]